MDEQQRAAYVFSQSVCALIELEAMKQENRDREAQGMAPAYNEKSFMKLHEDYLIGCNAVIEYFRG